MKKLFGILLIVIVILIVTFSTVAASTKFTTIKGVVTEVVDDLVTIETKKGNAYHVHVPEDFDPSTLIIGDDVLAKAHPLEDGTWQATTFQILEEDEEEDEGEEEEDEEETEGTKLNSAFCNPEKQGRPHPLAVILAARFGVEEEWVMNHYCNGVSIGSLMLALKTSSMEGVEADADTLIELKKDMGWGQIWKELKLIGNEKVKTNGNGNEKAKEKNIPPGQLKKQADDN